MRGFRASRAFKTMSSAKYGKQDYTSLRNHQNYPAHHQPQTQLPAWLRMPSQPPAPAEVKPQAQSKPATAPQAKPTQLKLVSSNGKPVDAQTQPKTQSKTQPKAQAKVKASAQPSPQTGSVKPRAVRTVAKSKPAPVSAVKKKVALKKRKAA